MDVLKEESKLSSRKRSFLFFLVFLITAGHHANAFTTVGSTANAYMVENTSGTSPTGQFCYEFQTNPTCLTTITGLSTATLSGAILNQATLQTGAQFNIPYGNFNSSMTVSGVSLYSANNQVGVNNIPPATGNQTGTLMVQNAGGGAYSFIGRSIGVFQSTSSFGGVSIVAPAGQNTFLEFDEGSTKEGAFQWNSGSPGSLWLETNGSFALTTPSASVNYLTVSATGFMDVPTALSVDGPFEFHGNPGTSGQIMQSNGSSAAPSWIAAPNSIAPTVQRFTSGSGTYTLPTSPKTPIYIDIIIVGGGGGGSGSGTTGGGSGSSGNNTTFGSTATAGGGSGAVFSSPGASGGTNTTAGITVLSVPGGAGGGAAESSATLAIQSDGQFGGSTPLAGGARKSGGGADGASGTANTGEGGQGGGTNAVAAIITGSGGGGGAYQEFILSSPSATYSYSVGSGGGGGTAGTSGQTGGSGGSGLIVVKEYYQ